jgi:DOPA 4,5-dioxygenase
VQDKPIDLAEQLTMLEKRRAPSAAATERHPAMSKESTAASPMKDAASITEYHAHIYYDPATTRARAERLRERVGTKFPQAKLGRWHDELVGPHTQSMYQIAFPAKMIGSFVPWLMLNRDGLTILLHPETGDSLTDHTAHAAWFGAVLPVHLEAFKNSQ